MKVTEIANKIGVLVRNKNVLNDHFSHYYKLLLEYLLGCL